jgi:hypothetical protein
MELTNLQNANIETLTPLIKIEFEKIYFEFSSTQQKPIYLHSVLNSILTYKSLNILLNDENKTFTNKDFIKYQDMFNTGFKEGYLIAKEYIDGSTDIKIKIDRVFGGIYKKLNSLKETHTFLIKSDAGDYSFELMEYYNYSIEVGKFVVCWDYILNNSSLFEEIFNLNYTEEKTASQIDSTLNWNGTQTAFIELVKALIENGNIKGTQTEIISKLSNIFNIKINNEDKLINDLKIRNHGSETLFLDKLQKSLFDYITHEKKK